MDSWVHGGTSLADFMPVGSETVLSSIIRPVEDAQALDGEVVAG